MTNDAWFGALKLATMWKYDHVSPGGRLTSYSELKIFQIRCQAITVLDPYVKSITAKGAVLLAKKYHVAMWLHAAYARILQTPFKIEDLLQSPALDWETIARLLYAKQLCLLPSGNATYHCTFCRNPVRRDLLCTCSSLAARIIPSIEESFQIEFEGYPPLPGEYTYSQRYSFVMKKD